MPPRPDRAHKHRPHPLLRAEFARRSGRARSSITEACGGPLAPACMPGGRIDAAHPAVASWARARGIDPASLLSTVTHPAGSEPEPDVLEDDVLGRQRDTRPRARIAPPSPPIEGPAVVIDIYDWTFGRVLDTFGSSQAMADWLDCRKTAAEIHRLESRNARDAGRLISRELVRLHVLGLLDEVFTRLLQNASSTIALRLLSAAGNITREEGTKLVHDAIGSELRLAKARAVKALRACRAGDNPPEVKDDDADVVHPP